MQKVIYLDTNTSGYARTKSTIAFQKEACMHKIREVQLATRLPNDQCVTINTPTFAEYKKHALGGININKNFCEGQLPKPPNQVPKIANGYIMEPSTYTYVNTPISSVVRNIRGCNTPNRLNPPNDSRYADKDSVLYDPVRYVFGAPYTY